MAVPKTVVEFIDRGSGDSPVHVCKEIRVNGQAVTVAEDGVDIESGRDLPTTVTLRLICSEVHFRHDDGKVA